MMMTRMMMLLSRETTLARVSRTTVLAELSRETDLTEFSRETDLTELSRETDLTELSREAALSGQSTVETQDWSTCEKTLTGLPRETAQDETFSVRLSRGTDHAGVSRRPVQAGLSRIPLHSGLSRGGCRTRLSRIEFALGTEIFVANKAHPTFVCVPWYLSSKTLDWPLDTVLVTFSLQTPALHASHLLESWGFFRSRACECGSDDTFAGAAKLYMTFLIISIAFDIAMSVASWSKTSPVSLLQERQPCLNSLAILISACFLVELYLYVISVLHRVEVQTPLLQCLHLNFPYIRLIGFRFRADECFRLLARSSRFFD